MRTTARLRRVGGSTMVAIPSAMLEALALGADSTVDLSVAGGAVVLKPARARYTLEELLAACDPDAGPSDQDRDWLDSPRVGGELI